MSKQKSIDTKCKVKVYLYLFKGEIHELVCDGIVRLALQ